jgi:hypothetical protein
VGWRAADGVVRGMAVIDHIFGLSRDRSDLGCSNRLSFGNFNTHSVSKLLLPLNF